MSRVNEAFARAASYPSTLKEAEIPGARLAQDDLAGSVFLPQAAASVPPLTAARSDTLAGSRPTLRARLTDSTREDFSSLLTAADWTQSEKFVTGRMEPGAVEQYRRLAAALHHMKSERGLKTLLVSSAVPGEGKTLTACNLALTLSESYKRRVLLIDGDLRRPGVHNLFRLPNRSGLSEWLKSTGPTRLMLQQLSETLSVLPSGHPDPDPMGGLTSERMRQLVGETAAPFDWVIIDTPPVGLLPDANLLAATADAVLMVVRAGATPLTMLQRAFESVGPERVVGVVLNGTDPAQLHGAYAYGKYYTASPGRES
jgi:capsular exopolysaccharide synthesis family protein